MTKCDQISIFVDIMEHPFLSIHTTMCFAVEL